MRVGIDLDGVLYPFVDCSRDACRAADPAGAAAGRYDADAKGWDFFRDEWGLTPDEFWGAVRAWPHSFNSRSLSGNWKAMLDWCHSMGWTVHVVTARRLWRSNTILWLESTGFEFDSVHFTRDKQLVDVDVLIDDNTENINAWVDTGRIGIVWDQPWNHDCWRATYRARNLNDLRHKLRHYAEHGAPKETVLEEANRLIYGDRGTDYGHPIEDFTRTAGIWNALWGLGGTEFELGPEDVALAMMGVKMSREKNRAKRDNAVDIAGYAGTLQMVREKQAELGAA